ncbi:hypothetical protein FSP39_023727 [Pinctada imbricata]|uniref:BRCT domain-containing protein n=1 Tax=Pinctada imbricata TaxID=66713 RepID=A0AA89BY56_PINIB|nr:hypothetical protein FSP39_023727 [Pinctada imbricata]
MEDDNLPATQPVDDRVLKDVVAYVEVRSGHDNRSRAVCKELVQLGAVVEKKFTDDVTHVIFKEGSKRTINKAQKKGIHLLSVLWVDSCKRNQEHVSERMYPATLPNQEGTPLLLTKLKKAKSMQPVDFEEELANSAERCAKRKRRRDKKTTVSTNATPTDSPHIQSRILVPDTQPRTPMNDMSTPIRLYIPDTPPSMRAKMESMRKAREDGSIHFCLWYSSDINSMTFKLI